MLERYTDVNSTQRRRYLGLAEVEVHAVVGDGDGLEVEVPHAVDLELEGQRRLQVPVDAVLRELKTHKHKTAVTGQCDVIADSYAP